MWGPVLRKVKDHEFTFITTNYDRAIELAANVEGVLLADGFDSFTGGEIAPWVGFNTLDGRSLLVKLHGSTDWYTERKSGDPLKLRHPMPLFGRGTLRLSNGTDLGSALVLPSREKLLTRAPYPRLSQAFLNAADRCEAAVFIGSSLRDPHIHDAAVQIASKRPVFVINPSGNSLGVSHAQPIAQDASEFLISTLPTALHNPDPVSVLSCVQTSLKRSKLSIIALLQVATDSRASTDQRCEAIERLDNQSVILDDYLIQRLLSEDDGIVARYALGLIPISPDRNTLLTAALNSAHAAEPAFAEELTLLKQMMGERVLEESQPLQINVPNPQSLALSIDQNC